MIRVVPCLDIEAGRVVKGINFVNLQDVGDPAELASAYERAGADELVFLDISASHEGRSTQIDLVKSTRAACTIPFAVGGGMSSIEDVAAVLEAGADKVSLGSAAVTNPELIAQIAQQFGSDSIIIAIDALAKDKDDLSKGWEVVIKGGREKTGIDACAWAKKAEELGAGALLVTSMDTDGVKDGYDIALTRAIADSVSLPVTASGGAGKLEDFVEAVAKGRAQAVLAASVFHYGEISIREVKEALQAAGFEVSL